ncbi:MAG: hypothetical protein P1V19_18340 [Gimesia sp.]|nr:hypothetical protein [Gimesia sp.]
MTIKVSCGICGKNYKAPDKAAGKRLRCKECGETIKVPEPEPEYDEDDFTSMLDDAVELESKSKSIPRVARKPMVKAEKYQGDEDGPETRKKENNYTQDLTQTFLFLLDPANLFTFVMIWILLCCKDVILPFAGIFGMLGQLIILGWYSNYRFSIIYEAASGTKELPDLSPEEGFFIPMLQWIATWILVHFPAYLYLAVVLFSGISNLDEGGMFGIALDGLSEILPVFHFGVFVFLYCAGLFFWPILALCIAVGGFGTIFRIDLMVVTIFRTPVIYLFTASAVFLTAVLQVIVMIAARQAGIGAMIAVMTLVLYLEFVTLRMIGHYYHHFKKRFAWNWG